MDMRLPRDAGCVGLCSADMLARIRQTSFRRISPSEGNKGRVPLRVHDGGLRGLGGMLVEAGQETRRESVVKASGCGRNRWLARGQRSAVSSTSGKDDGSLAGLGMDGQWDGRWARWVTCRGHLSQRSEAHLISRFILSAGLVMARGACVSTSDCVPRTQSGTCTFALTNRARFWVQSIGISRTPRASTSLPSTCTEVLGCSAAGLVPYLICLRLHTQLTLGMYMTSPLRFHCIILVKIKECSHLSIITMIWSNSL